MNSKDERKDKPTSPSAVKDRFFTKHKRTLSTSRSTPSFPDLINKAISKETSGVAEAELSSAMRRGSSSQTVNERMEDKPKKKT
jgi:hypothetical protein